MSTDHSLETRTVTDQGATRILQLVRLRRRVVLVRLLLFGLAMGAFVSAARGIRRDLHARDYGRYYQNTPEFASQMDACLQAAPSAKTCARQIPIWTEAAYRRELKGNTFVRFDARRAYFFETTFALALLSGGLAWYLFNFELRYLVRGAMGTSISHDLVTLRMILEVIHEQGLEMDAETDEYFAAFAKDYREHVPMRAADREACTQIVSLWKRYHQVRRLNAQWYS